MAKTGSYRPQGAATRPMYRSNLVIHHPLHDHDTEAGNRRHKKIIAHQIISYITPGEETCIKQANWKERTVAEKVLETRLTERELAYNSTRLATVLQMLS